MSAPTATARQTPGGRKIGDGRLTSITFASDPDIEFYEQSVTPFGVRAGDPNDTSTNLNTRFRTKSPTDLIELTDGAARVYYDPLVINSIIAIIGIPTTITYTYPDGSTDAVYGFLKEFVRGELVEKKVPEANIVIVHTCTDPITCDEEGPVYTAGAGTAC